MPRLNMPDDWSPPAPAWEARWAPGSQAPVVVYFGVQGEPGDAWTRWQSVFLLQVQDNSARPYAVEHGRFKDLRGIENHLTVAYWQADAFTAWMQLPGADSWWLDEARDDDGCGYWREVLPLSFDRFETLHSTPNTHGVSVGAGTVEGPILEHGYPGGARDRIPVSACEDLSASFDSALRATTLRPGCFRVQPPENLCVIRSGQDWSHCDSAERSRYLSEVHPVLIEGMQWLSHHPEESRCFQMRFVEQYDVEGTPLSHSFGYGLAADIFAFENWAKSHPTHLAIFDAFLAMANDLGDQMRLQLWHEVSVQPVSPYPFDYINCHADTGLLGYVNS